jgi:hypothetical protein
MSTSREPETVREKIRQLENRRKILLNRKARTHRLIERVYSEILLPAHAPPSFSDRSAFWNSVEKIRKTTDELARSERTSSREQER